MTFFPRWFYDDQADVDQWFDRHRRGGRDWRHTLAAAIAVLTSVAGTMLGRVGIRSLAAQGLATGMTAHGEGTALMLV